MKLQELRHIVWSQMGVRVSDSCSEEELRDFLDYKTSSIKESEVNNYRDELIEFIEKNRGRLSLPCNGNCYEHTDTTVRFCHNKLTEDT